MNLSALKTIAKEHQVRIDDFENTTHSTKSYFDTLRQAFVSFFNTYISNNSGYIWYAQGPKENQDNFSKLQLLDIENTTHCIVLFQRFFELFIKDLLFTTHENLIVSSNHKKIDDILLNIETINPNANTLTFANTLDVFYGLLEKTKKITTSESNHLVIKFSKIVEPYPSLNTSDNKDALKFLNWWRNRILHRGTSLPTMWLLDFMVTQQLLPMISEILATDIKNESDSLFYLKTISGIDILSELLKINFDFQDFNSDTTVIHKLIKIGHLKEIGRSASRMNFHLRVDFDTHEYANVGAKNRAKKIAESEKEHINYKKIKTCICCNEETLVLYSVDVINPRGQKETYPWVKCYTCGYYLNSHLGEPFSYGLGKTAVFG